MTAPKTHLRNAELADLVTLLRTNHARKIDVVAPVAAVRAQQGLLVVQDAIVELGLEGVDSMPGEFLPTSVCDDGLADRLGITPGYLRRLRDRNIELYDQNVNGWLAHPDFAGKNYLVRGFGSESGGPGVGRAFLSDSYRPIDDLDVLMTVLEGIREAGVETQIKACDLTDRNMHVQVVCEQIAVNAYELVKGYRSPFNGKSGADLPMMFAGFRVRNSEVGHGRFSIAPEVVLQVCSNGMTHRAYAVEAQHLGQKLEVGQIRWSEATQKANLELITRKTADAVRTFLDPGFVQKILDLTLADAGVPVRKPEDTVKHVAKELRYSEAQQDSILAMFIRGGDLTSGGVMHAVTAAAQEQADADIADEMESAAPKVLALAAAFAARN